MLHRTSLGSAGADMDDEDALIEAVLARLGGLGRLEPLLRAAMSRTSSSTARRRRCCVWPTAAKVEADPIARTDEELRKLLQQLGTTLADGSSREFSDARPLLALRLKAVGGLGARLSAATDVTPHPVGTIRIHRHAEADLDEAYGLGMIDAPLREFLRASVLAGLKIAVVGAMGHGKTFLLRSLCSELPLDHMIVTVEDERELGLHVLPARDHNGRVLRDGHGAVVPRRHPALVRAYESRPANAEGYGGSTVGSAAPRAARLGRRAGAGRVPRRARSCISWTRHQRHQRGDGHLARQQRRRGVRPHRADGPQGAPAVADRVGAACGDRAGPGRLRAPQPATMTGSSRRCWRSTAASSANAVCRSSRTCSARDRTGARSRPDTNRPTGTARLAAAGFDTDWLNPALSDWDRPHTAGEVS